MIILILAGGLGTRLRSKVKDVPKPMAPVANKPFLSFVFSQLISEPLLSKIVISVGYKSEAIKSFFGNSFEGIPIEYCREDEPLGTGGAIKNFVSKFNINEPFFVKNGDTFFKSNLNNMKTIMDKYDPSIVLEALRYDNKDRYGTLELQDVEDMPNVARLIGFFNTNNKNSLYINAGCYLLKPSIFREFPCLKFSLESDMFHKLAIKNEVFCSKSNETEFIDIGIPVDYQLAQSLLIEWSK